MDMNKVGQNQSIVEKATIARVVNPVPTMTRIAASLEVLPDCHPFRTA